MKVTFLGATHEVTGSCYYLEAAGKRFLVDYGMEQGKNIYENKPIPVPAAEIDFVLLTHAHIDHSGMLPVLYARGFRGPVYTTDATADLCDIMLRDSAHIQEFEAEWRNRKGKRAGKEDYVPPYTMKDALGVIELLVGKPYNQIIELAKGIKVRFVDAGHLLGSASIEIWLTEGQTTRKMVFSGDIGNLNQPLIRDPQYIQEADYVVMESTYGDRSHGPVPDYVTSLARIIQETFDRGGNVVIPSFAVGRTQEMLYFIRQIKEQHLVQGHGDFPVYVDSPLAIEATTIFQRHPDECYDEDAKRLIEQGINPIAFSNLKTSITAADSKAINFDENPKVIISASGMCDAGRVKHHLKHNLWRPECTILFVGYQAVGTPGRAIADGAESIRLFGEEIAIKAHIEILAGMSGHADNAGLMKWASSFKEKPKKVFVCHGEDTVTEIFAERLRKELGYDSFAPFSGTVFDIASGEILEAPAGIRITGEAGTGKLPHRRASAVYERLAAAGQRLLAVIRRNEGGANKDLAKFTDQINALCDKWDR
ncbi:MAG: MBL fold metallo-hydrolase [Eubacterium sp.]|nr:MBL fold metallo-hydrolase [Eubacterium sp.]